MDTTNDPGQRHGEFPEDLEGTVARVRAERPTASAIELDALQRRVLARVRDRHINRRDSSMKSRIAVTLMLVFGMGLSTTGAGLAVTGASGQNDAAGVVYGQPGGNQLGGPQAAAPTPAPAPTPTVAQTTPPAPEAVEQAQDGGSQPVDEGEVKGEESESSPAPAVQAAGQVEVADATTGDSLPFTGFSAIPVLLAGLALMAGGLFVRRRTLHQGL
jgi:hypothetical protein